MSDFVDDGILPGTSTAVTPGELSPGATIGDPSKVVTARGTEDGLILRIDGRSDWDVVLRDLESFLGGRRKFFEGGEVSIEWLERLPTKEQGKQLEDLLRDNYGLEVVTRRRRPEKKPAPAKDEATPEPGSAVTIKLFKEATENESKSSGKSFSREDQLLQKALTDRIEKVQSPTVDSGALDSDPLLFADRQDLVGLSDRAREAVSPGYVSRISKLLGDDVYYDEDANAKIVWGTLRSGQRVETPFSLVIIGDVNPGADLTAGGDIIVLGSLRGTAHASAYDDDSFDHVIISLQMQPMQLRIGSVISRGSDEVVRGAEIARIENRRIIVEQFNPRVLFSKKLR